MSDTPAPTVKTQLRRQIRAARRALSQYQQRLASQRLCARLALSPELKRARHIGIYWPMDGEIDPRPLLARFPDKHFYLPALPRGNRSTMTFLHWTGSPLRYRNRYGIPEPLVRRNQPSGIAPGKTSRIAKVRPPHKMDLVLLPLVAFDPSGARLGMGAGYYDRTFAFKRLRPGSGPKLVGIAHQLQCVHQLTVESWDIPLSLVATDQQLYRCT
ncbi:5-formyltetrahydrofolate cyclo-ligase [Microbulbifer sp. CAU 1566]|uniref:5-formyltetrahydrofolate cyclo-ligase n=1 Tax=Microbulbifer sp. CAU 1566 TaxID=2933269 RepID=UPI0020033607|nr:5-formyltetrahydrofolate cyclo-ligase [Microbulbifer sp. CAU 1566]MCK7596439.1 5-formyltetrahydrofolate cyclo-ligase [Microbulbifer sp. CAU 1566]